MNGTEKVQKYTEYKYITSSLTDKTFSSKNLIFVAHLAKLMLLF